MRIIEDYVRSISFDKKNPIEFFLEDGMSVNPYHHYIVRKVISQLKVQDHIHSLGPVLKTNYVEDILRTNNT